MIKISGCNVGVLELVNFLGSMWIRVHSMMSKHSFRKFISFMAYGAQSSLFHISIIL